jgi:hypothetical protein
MFYSCEGKIEEMAKQLDYRLLTMRQIRELWRRHLKDLEENGVSRLQPWAVEQILDRLTSLVEAGELR